MEGVGEIGEKGEKQEEEGTSRGEGGERREGGKEEGSEGGKEGEREGLQRKQTGRSVGEMCSDNKAEVKGVEKGKGKSEFYLGKDRRRQKTQDEEPLFILQGPASYKTITVVVTDSQTPLRRPRRRRIC